MKAEGTIFGPGWPSGGAKITIEASESGPGGNPSSRFPTAIDVSAGGRRAVYSTWRRSGINGSR